MSDRYELPTKTILVLSKDLRKRDKSFNIHQRNIQSLAIKLFKFKGNLSNTIMYDIFQTRKLSNYNEVTNRIY